MRRRASRLRARGPTGTAPGSASCTTAVICASLNPRQRQPLHATRRHAREARADRVGLEAATQPCTRIRSRCLLGGNQVLGSGRTAWDGKNAAGHGTRNRGARPLRPYLRDGGCLSVAVSAPGRVVQQHHANPWIRIAAGVVSARVDVIGRIWRMRTAIRPSPLPRMNVLSGRSLVRVLVLVLILVLRGRGLFRVAGL